MGVDEKPTFIVGREIITSAPKTNLIRRARRTMFDGILRNTQGKMESMNLPANDTLEVG